MPKFLIQGCEYYIEVTDLEQKACTLEPLPLAKFTHIVEIGDKAFPMRQLLAAVLAVPMESIRPLEAYRILERLGCFPQFCRNGRNQETDKRHANLPR